MSEALGMCDDRDSMMALLHAGEECEQYPQIPRQARAALLTIPPHKLCEESKAFMERLGPNPFKIDAKLSMSSELAPAACTAAQLRCGASQRCNRVASEIEASSARSAASNGQMLELLKVCGNRTDFFAVLDVAAECPGNSLQGKMRSLQQSLRNAPQSGLCNQALKEVRKVVLASAPMASPPLACIRAHRACSFDTGCSQTLHAQAAMEHLEDGIVKLCGNKHSFLLAMQVAVECPGPQPRNALRSSIASLANTLDADLCAQARPLLDKSDHQSKALESLDENFAEAVQHEAVRVAIRDSEDLVAAFDTTPHDGSLNALELEAMLQDASAVHAHYFKKAHEVNMNSTLDINLPEGVDSFKLKALDFSGNGFVEAVELASALTPRVVAALSNV